MIIALSTALQAARTGKTVVVAEEVGAQMAALSVAQSLAYLDVAVLCSGRSETSWGCGRCSRACCRSSSRPR